MPHNDIVTELRRSNKIWEINLDYLGENNFASFFPSNAYIHSYPAKAVPDMVYSILNKLKQYYGIKKVLDPFVGSGTVALESKLLGLDFYGSDLNPLSVLLAKTKALTINNSNYIDKQIRLFLESIDNGDFNYIKIELVYFKNIAYWFKPKNIRELSYIKNKIDKFLKSRTKKYKETFALILLTAFSSTVRSVSLTRNNEFKLYRMAPSEIKNYNINAIEHFKEKVISLLDVLDVVNEKCIYDSKVEIYLDNAKDISYMGKNSVDVILTSPPYGDSKSTVAYGEFSRLPLQWTSDLLKKYLNINVYADDCDEYLLGGKKSDYNINLNELTSKSITLQKIISEMDDVIKNQLNELEEARAILNKLINLNSKTFFLSTQELFANETIETLIKEKIRLCIYRKIKNNNINIATKQLKKLAKVQTETCIKELFSNNMKKRYKRTSLLRAELPYVLSAIKRRINYLPRRKNQIINFFKDMYKVIKRTDEVLENKGFQAWIVGHRTVFGKINVNLAGVLKDWFMAMNYIQITSLNRKYSFKRMPHHINSTVTRKEEIKTMMEEYILVFQKN